MSKLERVIYTSFDDNTPHWKNVEESVRDWAKRCDAELVNLPKPVGYQPQWVIFDAFKDSVERNVQAAWIDCDILVQRSAPNIFDAIPDHFYFCQPDPARRIHPRMKRNWRRYGLTNPRPYLVSALAMWSPRHVHGMIEWFDKEWRRFHRKDGDQELLTVAVFETETHCAFFPDQWHKMSKWIGKKTPFMHAAGKRKGRKLRRFKAIENREGGG